MDDDFDARPRGGHAPADPAHRPAPPWPTRLRALRREIARFGVVGIAGVFVSLAVFNLLQVATGLPTVRANIIATLVSIAFNYLGYRYFTYRDADRSRRGREVCLFGLFSAVGAVVENGVLYAATRGMHWDSPPAANFWKVTGIGLGFLFRFWSYRTWVFCPVDPGPGERRADPARASGRPARTPGPRR